MLTPLQNCCACPDVYELALPGAAHDPIGRKFRFRLATLDQGKGR